MRHLFYCIAFTAAFSACLVGGANQGGNQPGNKEGGTNLAVGEIAVDSDGRYFLSRAGTTLVVGDLETRSMRALELPAPYVVSFWPAGGGIFVLSLSPDGTNDFTNGSETLLSFDLETDAIVWQKTLPRQDFRLDVSQDGSRLLLADLDDVVLLDAETGLEHRSISISMGIADIDVAPTGDRVVITHSTRFDAERLPFTDISVHSLEDGTSMCQVTAPNCASELVLTKDGTRAFLAPTFCGRDPVSVIDLSACAFEKNLPGFGPVALSPSGDTAVAFIDKLAEDPQAPPRPDEVLLSNARYHLMFIDVETLEFETAPLGEVLPRYAFTPDGRTLVVDTDEETPQPIVLLDIDAKTVRTVRGPKVDMDDYVLTPNAQHAFVVDFGLYDLSLTDAVADSIPLEFIPISINMTPDGATLLLKDIDGDNVYLFETGTEEVSGKIQCGFVCHPFDNT